MAPDRITDFWGEIHPCDHLVQIYENHDRFLDSLASFVSAGLAAGEGVVVIATPAHLNGLAERLPGLQAARRNGQYIDADAEETLGTFMEEGWPDDERFRATILKLLDRARQGERRVRAFGEMVALMWARGQNAATVRLEHLWTELCNDQSLPLFCAYPRAGFTQDVEASISHIRDLHSRLVPEPT